MAKPIVKLAHEILSNPETVTIEPEVTTADKVEQKVCFVAKENKRPLLMQKLSEQGPGELTIVFSRTKHGANKLAKQITAAGFDAEAIHGNRSQAQRDRTLNKFRAGNLPVLVATDVAARGVDVKAVTLVINFDLPNEPEAYVHRIGRTGRAGEAGHAVSFCTSDELEYLRDIEKLIRQEILLDKHHDWHLDLKRLGKHATIKKAKSGGSGQGNSNRKGGNSRRRGGRRRGGRRPAKA